MLSRSIECPRERALVEQIQQQLIRLALLMRAEAEMLANRHENTRMAIDRQIENALGEKERILSALREHRRMHGC